MMEKPKHEWPAALSKAKVFCEDEEFDDVVFELWRRGVVSEISEEEIFAPGGVKCLQGVFGVVRPKDPVTTRGPGLRV